MRLEAKVLEDAVLSKGRESVAQMRQMQEWMELRRSANGESRMSKGSSLCMLMSTRRCGRDLELRGVAKRTVGMATRRGVV